MIPTKYCYNANGLNFASEMAFPEMRTADGPPDIVISYGRVPDTLTNLAYKGVCVQTSPGHYLLTIDGIAKYLLKDGKEVTIEPFGHIGENEDIIRIFFLSSVMGAVCHQRGILPLHASAIALKESCVLFAGNSAIGKSTLAAAFYAKGYPLISDDICAISPDNQGEPVVNPGYIQLKLWADNLKLLKNISGVYNKLRHEINKYSVIVKDGVSKNPLPIKKIYVLSGKNSEEISLIPLKGRSKFNSIIHNTYRLKLLKRIGSNSIHFKFCKRINNNTDIINVSKPYRLDDLEKLVTILEKDFI